MGCGGSRGDVNQAIRIQKPISVNIGIENKLAMKQEAINTVFSKNITSHEIPIEETPISEILTPKLNLVKKVGQPPKNVNLLIEDNTKVWDMSS